jgi:hypothetical protein
VGVVDLKDIMSTVKLTVEMIRALDSSTVEDFTRFGGAKCEL